MSRKITDRSIAAFLARRNFRKANMRVRLARASTDGTHYTPPIDGVAELLLHGNPIARLFPDGRLFITSARWNTRTTFDRLNGLPGVRIQTIRRTPFLNGLPWDGSWTEVTTATATPNPELF